MTDNFWFLRTSHIMTGPEYSIHKYVQADRYGELNIDQIDLTFKIKINLSLLTK